MENFKAAKLLLKRALNYNVPGRFMKIRESDIFLVSYPKSGNTWMRFLLANLITQKDISFRNFNYVVPDIYQTSKKQIDNLLNPRIIKSHEPFVSDYPKVIYIYRDPRDIVISYYFWEKKYKNIDTSIEEYIEKFIKGENSPYGPWNEHLKSWFNCPLKENNKILFLKYEDLKKDTFGEMVKVCFFLNLDFEDKKIREAIEKSDFKRMQKLEEKDQMNADYLKGSSKSIKFVRSGKSEWNQYFTEDLKKSFKDSFGEDLIKYKYESGFNW